MLLAGRAEEWVGLLPDPKSFSKYPEEARARMLAWNDAQITQKADRDDMLAKSECESTTRGQWLSFALNALFVAASLASFIVTRDPASFGFLGVPLVTAGVNIYIESKKPGKR